MEINFWKQKKKQQLILQNWNDCVMKCFNKQTKLYIFNHIRNILLQTHKKYSKPYEIPIN